MPTLFCNYITIKFFFIVIFFIQHTSIIVKEVYFILNILTKFLCTYLYILLLDDLDRMKNLQPELHYYCYYLCNYFYFERKQIPSRRVYTYEEPRFTTTSTSYFQRRTI